jgi:hypothetical protein
MRDAVLAHELRGAVQPVVVNQATSRSGASAAQVTTPAFMASATRTCSRDGAGFRSSWWVTIDRLLRWT